MTCFLLDLYNKSFSLSDFSLRVLVVSRTGMVETVRRFSRKSIMKIRNRASMSSFKSYSALS